MDQLAKHWQVGTDISSHHARDRGSFLVVYLLSFLFFVFLFFLDWGECFLNVDDAVFLFSVGHFRRSLLPADWSGWRQHRVTSMSTWATDVRMRLSLHLPRIDCKWIFCQTHILVRAVEEKKCLNQRGSFFFLNEQYQFWPVNGLLLLHSVSFKFVFVDDVRLILGAIKTALLCAVNCELWRANCFFLLFSFLCFSV